MGGGGQPFRNDNCRRHLIGIHGFSAEEARACVEGQESEKVRRKREVGRGSKVRCSGCSA